MTVVAVTLSLEILRFRLVKSVKLQAYGILMLIVRCFFTDIISVI